VPRGFSMWSRAKGNRISSAVLTRSNFLTLTCARLNGSLCTLVRTEVEVTAWDTATAGLVKREQNNVRERQGKITRANFIILTH